MKTLLLLASAGALLAADGGTGSLAAVRRIYIESLGASPQAIMLHDMVAASLASCGTFSVTENADRADAILRGSADDQVFVEQHRSIDNISAGLHSGKGDSYSSRYNHTSESSQSGLSIGENESSDSVERRHEAAVSVRLVNRDGDVIWSTTQESGGAKLRSASADVADRIVRKLRDDIQRARNAPMSTENVTPSR